MNFSDKVCLVTGGSRGIGRSICIELARAGAQIAINYNSSEQSAQKVAADVEKVGGSRVRLCKADISDYKQAFDLVQDVHAEFGRIDILVNNAGITKDTLLLRMTEKDWDDVLNVNLKGAYNTTKAAAKYMVKQRYGRIINISSIAGIYGNAGQANYAAAKAGIIGFTKSVAKELASRGITVNAIAPGFIKTDMTSSILEKDISIKDRIPLRRVGLPEDIAHLAVFLSSEKAGYITGQVVAIDGGLTL
jgi:3-oxoacyl-[acyl-carrier protein] reductase